MFKGLIDDLKDSTGHGLRMTALVASAGVCGFIALCFICAAVFITVLQGYGPVAACSSVAIIFVVIAAGFAQIYVSRQRRLRLRAEAAARAAAKAAANAPLIDPMLMATGLQIARAAGLNKLVPLLALAGVVAGYLASRNASAHDETSADDEDATSQESAESQD